MKPAPYCSPQMLTMLQNVAAGRSPTTGLSGRSQMGGANNTRAALMSRGWITAEYALTDAGRIYLVGRIS